MQRLISKARKAPRLARNAPRGAPTEQSLPKPPLELVHRLTRFHASEATSNSNGNENESEEHAQSILRWMQESPKCSSESDLKRMVDQYVDKKTPLAYILSNQPFGNVNILVEPPILIPRPETEEWTMRLISLINKTKGNIDAPARILDLCSGSGCISLALARAAPDFFITGLDVSEKAIELSRQNALRNKVQNVVFKKVDIFNDEELDDARLTKYDMIVSNPPYIPPAEYDNLDKSVKDYEDIRALVGKYQGFNSSTASSTITTPQESGEAGLDFYYRIRELASKLLSPREKRVFSREIPSLVLEFGKGQGKAMRDIFGDYYHRVKEDFNQIERTIEIHPHAKRLK